jgi:catechol 2,3-dioxygenase-like lactoylglutathione lyase family enzyme
VSPPLVGIRHVAIFTQDLEAAERFWVDVMGYAIEWHPDPDNLYLTSGRDNLALHRATRPSTEDRLDHIGLAVPRPEDVDAWAEHLTRHGVTLAKAPKQHRDGSRSLYFRDPGGILVQIIHHAPISQ